MRILWAFLRRDIAQEMSYRLSFFLQLLGIFPLVLMFFFLSRLVGDDISGPLRPYGGQYFPFVLIGIAAQNYLTLSLTTFSSSLRESQLSGTLEAVLVTPVGIPTFLLGSSLYSFVLNSVRIFLYLGLGVLLFQVKFDWSQAPVVFSTLLLTIPAFCSVGIFSASFIILFKKGDPLNWGFAVISWLLGGVYYPVDILPGWLHEAAWFLPMTHTLESLRMSLLQGQGFPSVGDHLFFLGLWAALGLPLSFLCFRLALKRARIQGSLGHY